MPVLARAVWVAGVLAECSSEASCHRSKSSPSSVWLLNSVQCLCVYEVACVIGVVVYGGFRANPIHGVKFKEQY